MDCRPNFHQLYAAAAGGLGFCPLSGQGGISGGIGGGPYFGGGGLDRACSAARTYACQSGNRHCSHYLCLWRRIARGNRQSHGRSLSHRKQRENHELSPFLLLLGSHDHDYRQHYFLCGIRHSALEDSSSNMVSRSPDQRFFLGKGAHGSPSATRHSHRHYSRAFFQKDFLLDAGVHGLCRSCRAYRKPVVQRLGRRRTWRFQNSW